MNTSKCAEASTVVLEDCQSYNNAELAHLAWENYQFVDEHELYCEYLRLSELYRIKRKYTNIEFDLIITSIECAYYHDIVIPVDWSKTPANLEDLL